MKDRFHVARCLLLSQDRADRTCAVDELCQRMSDPSQHSFSKLKRLVGYLKGERQSIQVFEFGDTSSEVTVFSDSDWAQREKRGSRQVRVALVGRHLLKAHTKKTEDHRQKQCRGRNVCSSIGSVRSEGGPELIIDAKSTEHILHRHGIGKMKHIDVAHLWLQDEVQPNRLRVRRVKSEDNLADSGTTAISNKIIRKHATSMGYIHAS